MDSMITRAMRPKEAPKLPNSLSYVAGLLAKGGALVAAANVAPALTALGFKPAVAGTVGYYISDALVDKFNRDRARNDIIEYGSVIHKPLIYPGDVNSASVREGMIAQNYNELEADEKKSLKEQFRPALEFGKMLVRDEVDKDKLRSAVAKADAKNTKSLSDSTTNSFPSFPTSGGGSVSVGGGGGGGGGGFGFGSFYNYGRNYYYRRRRYTYYNRRSRRYYRKGYKKYRRFYNKYRRFY